LIALLALSAHVQLSLVLGRPAPDAVHLAGGQRELETLAAHTASGAHFLGPGNLILRGPMRGDREK
jgi:hypothetical protein